MKAPLSFIAATIALLASVAHSAPVPQSNECQASSSDGSPEVLTGDCSGSNSAMTSTSNGGTTNNQAGTNGGTSGNETSNGALAKSGILTKGTAGESNNANEAESIIESIDSQLFGGAGSGEQKV